MDGSAKDVEIPHKAALTLQQHRIQTGDQHLTGIGKISTQQLQLFEALGVKKPA